MDALSTWHDIARQRQTDRLQEIISEDCVFLSPVVHTPQRGRDATILYLSGALQVFNDSFHYTKEIVCESHAVLEFECTIDGILINGVDIMTFAEDGRICEFRVMVRPLKGMQLLQEKMAAMLELLKQK